MLAAVLYCWMEDEFVSATQMVPAPSDSLNKLPVIEAGCERLDAVILPTPAPEMVGVYS